MSIEDFDIFRAKGRSLEIVNQYFEDRAAVRQAARDFAASCGPGALPFGSNGGISGICSPTPPSPLLWIPAPKSKPIPANAPHPCYVPNYRTKLGQALITSLHQLSNSMPTEADLYERLGMTDEGQDPLLSVLGLTRPRAGKVAGVVLIILPKGQNFTPLDAEKMKLSEYYALKESEEK